MVTRYDVVTPLAAEGGFGRISKANDTELERVVAIKTLDPLFKSSPSDDDKKRFRREAQTLASLAHPSIPAIYDVQFLESSEFRIIFQWIEGKTLREVLAQDGPVPLEQAQSWFSELCSALTHAHSKNVIHRDIKPSNIIIAGVSGTAYLVDFGIALRKDDLERLTKSTVIGTPGYMPPEQEQGKELSSQSDVFALSITLYECLAGQRPQIGAYQELNSINGSIPRAVDELIRAGLGINGPRLQTATEFSERLARALRPHASFTETLSDGELYEIQFQLKRMHPEDYIQLPAGQRRLLMSRLKDLMRVDEPRLRPAVIQLLAALVKVAHRGAALDYQVILDSSLNYGFERPMGDHFVGDRGIREELCAVALELNKETYHLLADGLLSYAGKRPLEGRERWYFHDLRKLLQNLLANPHCSDSHAQTVGDFLDKVNDVSHVPVTGFKLVEVFRPSK